MDSIDKETQAMPKQSSYFNSLRLSSFAPVKEHVEKGLAAATSHALLGEGSFSRANLTMATAVAFGNSHMVAEKLGAGIELFHLASLLLDDLPCMDNATLRRSRPCTHLVYGEHTAILGALGLINRAYLLLWEVISSASENQQKEAANLLDQCLGLSGILNGQAKDMAFRDGSNSPDEVLEIARLKTGSLLRMCLILPAILTGQDRTVKMYLSRLSDTWGMAYQVSDDLKDLFLGEGVSGKTACRDETLGRPNLALVIGTGAAIDFLRILLNDAEHALGQLSKLNPALLEALNGFQMKFMETSRELMAANAAA